MTNKDLIANLSQRLNWTQSRTSDLLDVTVSIMNEKLSEDAQLSLLNFGVFETRKKSERISVNPITKQRYLVPPKIVATFKPSTGLKEQFKNREDEQ